MRELRGTPAGKLRVHALPGFALGYFGRVLHRFQEAYPRIQLELVVSDALVDPVRDGFDCTLQIFAPVSDSLVAKRLFEWRPVFCASPAYLEANGEPARPADLTGHRLGLYSRYPTRDRWSFTSRTQNRTTTLDLKPFLRTNSVHLLRDYACADAGIVCVPTLVASDALLSGQLRALLRGYRLPTFALSAVYPSSHAGRSRLKLFLECLSAAHDDGPAPWDGALVEAGLIGA